VWYPHLNKKTYQKWFEIKGTADIISSDPAIKEFSFPNHCGTLD